MSLEAWGDEGEGGLSDWEFDRVEESAREKAADDPALEFPDDGDMEDIELEWLNLFASDGGWHIGATYRGCTTAVFVSSDILEPSEPDY